MSLRHPVVQFVCLFQDSLRISSDIHYSSLLRFIVSLFWHWFVHWIWQVQDRSFSTYLQPILGEYIHTQACAHTQTQAHTHTYTHSLSAPLARANIQKLSRTHSLSLAHTHCGCVCACVCLRECVCVGVRTPARTYNHAPKAPRAQHKSVREPSCFEPQHLHN